LGSATITCACGNLAFTAVATPEMMRGATQLYERMDEWHGNVPAAPFNND